MNNPDLTVLVPIFNEEESLPIVLPSLFKKSQEKQWQVILINDGSTDQSEKIIKKYADLNHVTIIQHRVNHGYGAALKSGLSHSITEYTITFDADGQHNPDDIEIIYNSAINEQADLVIGTRPSYDQFSLFRSIGKLIIRSTARFLMPMPIQDLNSGFKLYKTDLAKKYIDLCPDTMAFSDIITLIFINQRHFVVEFPISINERIAGRSKINFMSAYDTLVNVLDIAMMFNPLRFFLPLSFICILVGVGWGFPIAVSGGGISVGSILAITTGLIFFVIGLIASQLSAIRLQLIKK